MKTFKLHYYVQNNGDGSASVQFTKTAKEAEKHDEAQEEGWGESSADSVELAIKDGKIVRKSLEYDESKKKWEYEWIAL